MIGRRDILRAVDRLVGPLRSRVDNMIARVVLTSVKDSLKIQRVHVQGLADEDDDDLEHLQPGGVSHNAFAGAEGLLLSVGGRRETAVVVLLSERSSRPTGLLPGETVVYSTVPSPNGASVKLDVSGNADITVGTTGVAKLGGDSDFVALAAKVDAIVTAIHGVFNGWAPIANDGGAALKTAWTTEFGTPPSSPSVAATKAKAT